jgi:CRISPR/Cas system-associated protein Csm6
MNVTLSIDDQTLARAQQVAQQRGMSLDEMIQNYLVTLTASDPAQALAELENLWREEEGDSGGWKWNREGVYDLAELVSRIPKDYKTEEVDMGPPVGREEW